MINPRIERKMGNEILETMSEIYLLDRSNLKRFKILQHRLDKRIKRFKEYTGRDTLGPQFADIMVKAPTPKVEEITHATEQE